VSEQPRPREEKAPEKKPAGRTPYPVEHPGISDQPGTAPDYIPATPTDLPKF